MSRPGRGFTFAELKKRQLERPTMTREGLRDLVKVIRKFNVCAYRGDRCDCKYGCKVNPAALEKTVAPSAVERPFLLENSEQTGCPELYDVIGILDAMTNKEFNTLFVRAMNKKGRRW